MGLTNGGIVCRWEVGQIRALLIFDFTGPQRIPHALFSLPLLTSSLVIVNFFLLSVTAYNLANSICCTNRTKDELRLRQIHVD
jgi:hypothetical protein